MYFLTSFSYKCCNYYACIRYANVWTKSQASAAQCCRSHYLDNRCITMARCSILLVIRWTGVGYGLYLVEELILRPHRVWHFWLLRLDIILIRQPNTPNNKFIIPLSHYKYLLIILRALKLHNNMIWSYKHISVLWKIHERDCVWGGKWTGINVHLH